MRMFVISSGVYWKLKEKSEYRAEYCGGVAMAFDWPICRLGGNVEDKDMGN